MNKFELERTNKVNLVTNKFKKEIPIVWISPRNVTNDSCVFIYCCGLGGTNSFNVYMNHPAYDQHYFITYDKMGHGDNQNKPSQFKRKYLVELDCIVNWAKNQFPNRKIFLLGESWGCSINFLYYKKYFSKIHGVINWNMPTKPHSPVKKTLWQYWQFVWRELVTLLTNINLQLPLEQTHAELLTTNPLLVRAMKMMPSTRNSTRLTLAVWRYMRPSYKFLLRNCNNNKYNFLYVQSGKDYLMIKRDIDRIEQKANVDHFLIVPSGYHILTMEPQESTILYNRILEFIKK